MRSMRKNRGFLSSRSTTLLPPAVLDWMKRSLLQLIGLAIILSGLTLAACLMTYHPLDPSWNTASNQVIQNLLQSPGAITADFLLQNFGLTPFLFVLFCLFYGGRILFLTPSRIHNKTSPIPHLLLYWRRCLFFSFGSFCSLCLILSLFPAPKWWTISSSLGGALGNIVLETALFHVSFLGVFKNIISFFILTCFFLMTFLASIDLKIRDMVKKSYASGCLLTRSMMAFFMWSRQKFSQKTNLSEKTEGMSPSSPFSHRLLKSSENAYGGLYTFYLKQYERFFPPKKMPSVMPSTSAEPHLPKLKMPYQQGQSVELTPSPDIAEVITSSYSQDPESPEDAYQQRIDEELHPYYHVFPNSDPQNLERSVDEVLSPEEQDLPYSAPFDDETMMTSPSPAPFMQRRFTQPRPPQGPQEHLTEDSLHRPQKTSTSEPTPLSYNNELILDYELPSFELLDEPASDNNQTHDPELLEQTATDLLQVLEEFGVRGEIVNVCPGPVVTLYELKPAAGIKTSRVIGLADDIARSMCALSARIAVIPGRNVIGIELPNRKREMVYMKDMLKMSAYTNTSSQLALILGKDIGGQAIIADLARMPHLLVAGTTGSGKSVSINTMILSILFRMTPDQCKFIMIDPKMLELSIYDDIPHLLTPVVTDPKKAVVALKWVVREMENRYRVMSKMGVRNMQGYNERVREAKETGELLVRRVQTGFDPDSGKPIFESQSLNLEPIPFIVVVVDEMADLMLVAGKEIEAGVQRLAQMARAAGIHLIMATQRPSVDVITGTIKANFPTRISFQVTSKIDSRTILGEQGAEQLLGQGDMLYMMGGGRVTRVHGPFLKDTEVERIVAFLKSQGEPSYVESITEEEEEAAAPEEASAGDDLYRQAVELILREGKASTSFVQRHLQIGYNRAARIIEQMEKNGIISAANHSGKREVIGR